MRSGPARLSRCLAGRPSACIVTCSAQTCALLPPLTLQKAESRTSTFGSPSGSAINTTARAGWRPASFETEAVISCADSSSVTTIRLSTLERRASVPSSFAQFAELALYLPDAHPSVAGGLAPPPITASSTPFRPAREARRPPPVPRSRQDRTIPPASVTSASSRGRVSSRRLRPRRPG